MGGEKIMNRILKSDYFLMVISVLIAAFIWIYVVYEKNPMHEVWIRDLPINFINQSEDFKNGKLIVIEQADDKVDVKIRGRRTAISSAKLSKITCTVNMNDVKSAGDYSLPISVNFSTDGVEVLQKTPYNLSISVDEVVTKGVPINIDTTGTVKEGYVLGETQMSPTEIKITGPHSVLSKIKKAAITVDLTDISEDIKGLYKIKLYNSDNEEIADDRLSRNVDYADINFPVLSTKAVKLKVVLSDTKNSEGNKVTVKSVKPETVLIKGRAEDLSDITEIETQKIDVSELLKSGTLEAYLNPESLPENVYTADDGAMDDVFEVAYTVAVNKEPDAE